MEEKRELEEIKEVEWEMLDIELVKGFAREEGMAGDEAADETGNGRGEGILSMVSNAKTSSAFQRAQIHPSSVDLGQCWPMYLPPNGCPPTVLSSPCTCPENNLHFVGLNYLKPLARQGSTTLLVIDKKCFWIFMFRDLKFKDDP